jgi:hypothetical protein
MPNSKVLLVDIVSDCWMYLSGRAVSNSERMGVIKIEPTGINEEVETSIHPKQIEKSVIGSQINHIEGSFSRLQEVSLF